MTRPQSLSEFNSLSVEVYSSGTTLLNDPDRSARQFVIDGFQKHYPGGMYGSGNLRALRKLGRSWLVKANQRVVLRHGHDIAYEGWVGDLTYQARGVHSVQVPLVGATENFFMNRTLTRHFADSRVTEDAWRWDAAAPGADKCTPDRTSRLKHVPKNVQWISTDYSQYIYTEPTAQTVRRIKGSYNLQEGAQQWQIDIMRSTDLVTWTLEYTISDGTTPTGTFDRTMGTATRYIAFRFTNDSGGNQTPAADGSILGEIYNIMVYATIGSLTADITMETVARFFAAAYSGASPYILNSDTQYIASPVTPLTVEPFIITRQTPAGDLINDIVSDGDGALNRWIWQLLNSEKAATPNGLPPLQLAGYPDTTTGTYEYTIDYDDANLMTRPDLVRSVSTVYNWIAVNYIDADGILQSITPDDDASLKNQASIDGDNGVGRRDIPGGLDVGERSAAAALSFGQRFLATYGTKTWRVAQPLEVYGYLKRADGIQVPACMVEPGERIRITGGPLDETGEAPIFVMTGLDYRHRPPSLAIATGSPMGPLIGRIAASLAGASEFNPQAAEAAMSGGDASGGGDGGVKAKHDNWRLWEYVKAYARHAGIDPESIKGMSGAKRAFLRAAKAYRKNRG
jgi:hypothetical protein